jgi:opacity protein-like surface antigen
MRVERKVSMARVCDYREWSRGMFRKMRKFCVFVSMSILFICPVFSQSKFSIRLIGGISTITGGDLNEDIRQFHRFMSNLNGVSGYSANLDLNEMNFMFNLGGELVYRFNNNFGLGIGTEYLARNVKGPAKIAYSDSTEYWWGTGFDIYDEVNTHSYTLKAIPILLNLYYFIPWGQNKSIFLNFGIGYYFGSLKHKSEFQWTSEYSEDSWFYLDYLWNYSATGFLDEKTKTTTFGFHGGIGINLNLTSQIGVLIEARGRVVNFEDWDGDRLYEQSWEEYEWLEDQGRKLLDLGSEQEKIAGKLWLISFNDKTTDKKYKQILVFDKEPEISIRRAKIDLNGITLRVGIIIQF